MDDAVGSADDATIPDDTDFRFRGQRGVLRRHATDDGVSQEGTSQDCASHENEDEYMAGALRARVATAGRPGDGDDLLHLWRLPTRADGRRYSRPFRGIGKGKAPNTYCALRQSHALVLQCARCAALVDLQAARRRANAEHRRTFVAGDGCGSRSCSRNFRPGPQWRRQLTMAAALRDGQRVLVRWPACLEARAMWRANVTNTNDAAERAVAGAKAPS